MEESTELQVLSIIGMAGLGKTILAHKIFNNARIVYDIKSKTDKELADIVVDFLENERFLLVMDDLWSSEDWDKLKITFPMCNKMGRVLITSRIMEVGTYVNSRIGPHRMRFLSEDESFQHLRLEALRGQGVPPKLQGLGGILVKEFSSDMRTMKAAWIKVYKNLASTTSDDEMERMQKIIAMSYENLPYHSRKCFLYFGMFPEDFEIFVWKLIPYHFEK